MTREHERSDSQTKALKNRRLALESLHVIANSPSEGWFWEEMDQLAIDSTVAFLWTLATEQGLSPYACPDHSCMCHLWIAEGQPDESPWGRL